MLEGFVPDSTEGDVRYLRWRQGQPKQAVLWEIDPRHNAQWKLAGYRCERCGFVEFYAKEPTTWSRWQNPRGTTTG